MTKASPEKILRRLVDYMPGHYTRHPAFLRCVQRLDRGDCGGALAQLIALTGDFDHYFSDEFWRALARAAEALEMADEAARCQRQLARTLKVAGGIPFGWTEAVISPTLRKTFIAERIKAAWVAKRRAKDGVDRLIRAEGLHLRMDGRAGTLYYVRGGRLAEIDGELGVSGLILYFSGTTHWSLPKRQTLTPEEISDLRASIEAWAGQGNGPVELA